MADVNSDLVPAWAKVVDRLINDASVGDSERMWLQRTQPLALVAGTAVFSGVPGRYAANIKALRS